MRKIVCFVMLLLVLAACGGEPQQVEVTRIVTQDVPVTVEVTRVVTEIATVEVPVAVTRLVEVAAAPVVETAVPTAADLTPTPLPSPTSAPTIDGVYVVASGDNLSLIAARTGTAAADIRAANNLTNESILIVGQELIIPGWNGELQALEIPAAAPAPAEPTTPAVAVEQGPNLLPNPSFEGDWYFSGFNELQIPVGWQVVVDEGPNTLQPGAGGNFLRPEIRVIPAPDLPPAEQSLFIFEGRKTVKAFKGAAPTSFSLFTDLTLPPGSYRLRINVFPDTVVEYRSGQKLFAPDAQAAEMRIIVDNGGTAWQGTQSGQRNTLTYDFTLTDTQTVRVGASFRNRFVMANNGWFIDDWSLYALGTPDE